MESQITNGADLSWYTAHSDLVANIIGMKDFTKGSAGRITLDYHSWLHLLGFSFEDT